MLRALAIDPHYTDALYWCSGSLGALGRIETARPLAQRLLETDPLTSTNLCIPGWIEWLGGRFEAALPWYARWQQREPGHPMALFVGAMALIWNQQFDGALELLERLTRVAPSTPLTLYGPFLSNVLRGDQSAALAAMSPQLAAAALCSEFTCWQMAAFHAMIGANEQAVGWLERATHRGFINYPMLAEYDPFLKRLRGELRFTRLLDDVKREWESLDF
jgi:tetratricopeptide (TPR) repeat protein